MGAHGDRFPDTRRSAIFNASSTDAGLRARAWDTIVAAYWKPVYKYLRLRWQEPDESARDLTQGFFALAMEKESFARYDPARGSFRTYLRTCLDGFVVNEKKAAQRVKRGGNAPPLSLDFETAAGEFRRGVAAEQSLEEYFHQEWVRSLFALAIDELRRNIRDIRFRIFERYDLDGGTTYEALAAEFGISVTTVTNHLAAARRKLRQIVLEKLGELTADEREFRSEARAVLGVEV
jgi:RNA polymerase sigma factor (sigma-70 family)